MGFFFHSERRAQCSADLVPILSEMSVFLSQQTLPVDLSNSSVRSSGNSGASFHGSTSAFDPCCPGSTSRPPAYVSQPTPGPSQPSVVDSFNSPMVAQPQPQTQPQPCRHYMHPTCEYNAVHYIRLFKLLKMHFECLLLPMKTDLQWNNTNQCSLTDTSAG